MVEHPLDDRLSAVAAASNVTRPPAELSEFLVRYDEAIRSMTLGLRAITLEELAPCHEYIFEMRSKVMLLYGTTERAIADGICSIAVFRRHVTLSFSDGTDLHDPGRLLCGSGVTMRHIRVTTPHDLTRPELRNFLQQARVCAGLTPRRGQTAGRVVTRAKKRSPSRARLGSLDR